MPSKELSILLLAKDMASKTIGQVAGSVKKLGNTGAIVSRGMGTLANNVLRLGIGAGSALAGFVALTIKEGQEVAKVDKLFANAVHSSGKISSAQSAALVAQQSTLLKLTGRDDELVATIQTRLIQMKASAAQTLALTPLIIAAASATGKSEETVQMAVGKALQGSVTSLTRIGVIIPKISAEQTKAITGNKKLSESQKKAALAALNYSAILSELQKRFGAVNQSLSGTLEVRLNVLRETMASIREDMGIKLLPVITKIVDVVGREVAPAFAKLVDTHLPSLISGLSEFASSLENGGAESAVRGISDAIGTMIGLLQAAAGPVKMIVGAFMSMPKELQTVLVGAFAVNKLSGGMLTQLAGAGLGGLLNRGGTPANPLFVADVTGGLGKGAASAGTGILNMLKNGLSVGIAAASIAALAYEIGQFMNTVGQAQGELQGQVNATGQQTPQQSAANLGATANSLFGMNILDRAIAETFGGGQITADFIGAAQRLTAATMTSADATKALPGVQRALEYAQYAGFKSAVGPLQEALNRLKEEIAANTQVVSIADKPTLSLTATADDPRYATGAARLARMGERGDKLLPAFQAIFNRAWAHGKVPTDTALQATYLRNIERATTAATTAQRIFREGERADLGKVVSSSAIAAAIASSSARMLAVAQAVGAASIVAAIHGISAPKVIVNTTVSARETKVVTQKFERYQGKLVPVF